MSANTGSGRHFDLDAFKRAVESRDADTLVEQFADDAELDMYDRRTPPSSPTHLEGKAAIEETLRDLLSRDMTHEILQFVVEGDHAAYTERCTYPDGKQVMSMTMLDLRDGRIVHQAAVQAWDEGPLAEAEVGDFSNPDQSVDLEMGHIDTVNVGGHDILRMTLQPGWRWSEHAKGLAGTDMCMLTHCGYLTSGKLCCRMEDGTETVFEAGQVLAIPPKHDAWVVGDEPTVIIDWKARE